jgi:hydroxyacylglutathione hydrolase
MQRLIYREPNIAIFQSALFQTNSTVINTDDVVLVVDPAWLPDEVLQIRQFVDSIRANRPVFLVFTHSDYDHIIGYGAFRADKVFASKAFADNPDKEKNLTQIRAFDQQHYIQRNYPIEYPNADFQVLKDGVQYRAGQTKLTFYLAPGHTADSMMMIVWQLGLCIAGDYLSNVEFPIIDHSSVAYEETLEKLPAIHDKNWFTRLVPGHGTPSLGINDWLRRRTESLAYIYAVRESIATGVPIDEESLWARYHFPLIQGQFHQANVALMRLEYEQGLWQWDADMSADLFTRKRRTDPEPIKIERDEEG